MAGLSVGGIGSGMDVDSLVSQLVALEGQPASSRLNRREANIQAELSAIGTFKGALSGFKESVAELNDPTRFESIKAQVDNEDLLDVTTNSAAQPATYGIEVQQLAQSQKLASSAYDNVTDTLGTGTLTFRFGSYESTEDAVNTAFTSNANKPSKNVVIDATNNTLAGVRDAINQADMGVNANIVNDGTGYRLVFSSTETGAENALEITVSDDDGDNADVGGLSNLAYSADTKNAIQTLAAQDAQIIVDGLTVTSPTDSLDKVIQGVTLDLKSAELGKPTKLTISRDTAAITEGVSAFVEAYNGLTETVKDLTKFNPETGEKGQLLGDSTVRTVTNQLRRMITDTVSGAGELKTLSDIGISTERDGTLKLDSGRLTDAIKTDPQGVASLFARNGRTSDSLINYVSTGSQGAAGEYPIVLSQMGSQASFTGNAVNSLVIDANNNTFALNVDGIQSGTITLTQGTYDSATALADELQAQINSDGVLQTNEVSVSVGYDADSNQFKLTSNKYGGESSLEFTSVASQMAATLGFTVGAGIPGTDVMGTIGAVPATGVGQRLTGSGSTAGIALDVLGGVVGPRGTVSYSEGIAARLDDLLENMLNDEGPLETRTDSLNNQVEDIEESRESLDRRLEMVEARYRREFTAMDAIIGELSATGNQLSQQLASIPVIQYSRR
jgi:flagellar hook-associated protein 2